MVPGCTPRGTGQNQDHYFRHGRADLRGSVPVNFHHLMRAPDICFLGFPGQAEASSRYVSVGSTHPIDDAFPARNPLLPIPHFGRRVTMDERLCRSVRRRTPDDWCGTVVERRRHGQR